VTLRDKVAEVFKEVFDDQTLDINEKTTSADVDGWDSFMHITLIVALEEKFDIQFSTQELSEMTCVGDLIKILKEKNVQ
jgi:acyl carrier protein